MIENVAPHPLIELARTCAADPSVHGVLDAALPVLLASADARAVLHVAPTPAGATVAKAVGDELPWEPSDLPSDSPAHAGATDLPMPSGWAERGVTKVGVHRLPGDTGALVIAWAGEPQEDRTSFDACIGVVDTAIARAVAEERLADLTARVDNAQRLAKMGDYDWHIATDTNRWSDELYRIYGHEPQSFNASYERFLAHIHPDDRDRITDVHKEAYASGEPYEMLERIVRPDGEVRYLESNGQVIFDENGAPVRMRGTCIDITQRVLAEQDRERTAARFRSLVEASPDAILVLDHDEIVQANGRATALLGGDPVGHSITALVPSGRAAAQAAPATGLDGRRLLLDVVTEAVEREVGSVVSAAFLRDAGPRLHSESLAATLREVQVRRRQALEMNDNVVQGLSAAMYALDVQADTECARLLATALAGARHLMNDWLNPPDGNSLEAGDLVRAAGSTLDTPLAGHVPVVDVSQPLERIPRIVVVDDNDDVRRLVRVQIERVGRYEVVGEAVDGVDAVEVVTALRPDVVFLDLAMPRMDGLQALPLIIDAVPGVRVIVLSGFDQDTIAAKALAAGARRYVEKGPRINFAEIIDGVLSAA
jgi:PAS domain S-box-containing protein